MLRTRVGLATLQWMLTRGGNLRDGEAKKRIGGPSEQWYVIDSSYATPSSCAGFQKIPHPPLDLLVLFFLWSPLVTLL